MEKPEHLSMSKDTGIVTSFLKNLPCQNSSNFGQMEEGFQGQKSCTMGRQRCYKNLPPISIQTRDQPKPKVMVTVKPDPFFYRQKKSKKSSLSEDNIAPGQIKRMKSGG